MAFMFKGPASLTSGSVITDATSISSADLTVTDDLTIAQDLTVGDDVAVTGDITAASITAKINESVLVLTTMNSAGIYPETDISDYNVLYLANTSDATGTQTLKVTWRVVTDVNGNPPIKDGHHIFVAWVAKHASATSLKVNFNSISPDPLKIYSSGTNGANARILSLGGVGQHALFYYSETLNVWMANESNSATFTTS